MSSRYIKHETSSRNALFLVTTQRVVKVKVKVALVQELRLCTGRTAYRGVQIQVYPFMTTLRGGVRGQRQAPAALYPLERPGTHCTGGWVDPRTGLDRCGKSHPHRNTVLGPSSPQPVATLTKLPGQPASGGNHFKGSSALKMGPIGFPETSVRNCHYSLCNNPEERSSQLLLGGSANKIPSLTVQIFSLGAAVCPVYKTKASLHPADNCPCTPLRFSHFCISQSVSRRTVTIKHNKQWLYKPAS